MATLTGQRIKDTYDAVLKLEDNAALTSSPKAITDGLGNNTPISVSTIKVDVSSDLEAASFVKTSGLSTQFLKADGSVDSSAYLTSGDLPASHWSSNLVGIDYAGGNVGIGTTSPSTTLDVAGSITTSGALIGPALFEIIAQYANRGRITLNSSTNPSANQIALLTNGVPRMVVNKEGNVGIGTTSPSEKLDVNGNIKLNQYGQSIYFGSTVNEIKGSASNFLYKSFSRVQWDNAGTYTDSSYVFKQSGSEVFRIHTGGNVGIGTTSPSEKLEVAGDMNLYNPSATSQINFRNIGGANYIKSNGYSTHFGLRGNTGNGVFIIEDSFATTQDIRIKPTTSGWDFSSRGVAGVNALLTIDSVLNISNRTNVGIGTTSPSEKLDILNGNLNISAGYYLKSGVRTSIMLDRGSDARMVFSTLYQGATTGGYEFSTGYSGVKFLIQGDGNVGIGTTNPS